MKDKVLKNNNRIHSKEQVFLDAFYFTFGFIISFAKISGMVAPFCLSFSMALKKRASIFSFLGSIFGISLFLSSDSLIYLFILSFGILVKFLLEPNDSLKNAVFCALCFILPYTVFIFMFPVGFGSLMFLYSQTIFCAALTALCTQTLKNFSFEFKDKIYNFLVFLILCVVVLMSFCGFNFNSFNLGRFVADFFIIQVFLIFDYSLAAVFGVVATISFALFTKDFTKFGVILSISGFFGGLFKKVGRFFQIFLFFSTYLFCCIFFGGFNIASLIEAFVASIVSLAFPKEFFSRLISKGKNFNDYESVSLNDKLSLRLKFAANMLLDLQDNIKRCADIMDSSSLKDINNIYDNVAACVCKDCGLNTFCWVKSYQDLVSAFCDVSVTLRKDGSVNEKTLPIFLQKKCCKVKDMVQYINFSYKEYLCFEQNKRRVNEARDIAKEQFSGIADFLIEMSDEIKSVKAIDSFNTNKILEIFKKNGVKVKNLFCFLDDVDRTSIDVYLNNILKKEKLEKIKEEICDVLDKKISYSSFIKAGDNFKISFFEETEFSIEFSVEQVAVGKNKYCGDSYQYFVDERGYAHIILSDGMGNGKRAALDSLMTCSTLRKFIESGFGFNSALKLLNLSFAIKSKEETLATVDSCTIDLYTGEARFIKAGATSSYINTKGRILRFNSKSLPIGIIQGISFYSEEVLLSKGDVVVMVSDGATACDLDWISDELKEISKKDTKYIAKHILDLAKQKEDKEHLDDVTVIAFKIV